MHLPLIVAMAVFLTACAKRAESISAAYVSPLQYERLDCRQLGEEAQRVSARAATVAGAQDEKASRDAVAMGVGLVVFWPALFFIGGNDQQTAELARLRGEMEAIEQASIQRRCGIVFQKPKPQEPAASPAT
ncbi:hypothetical protein [Blastochloris tepida]|jgi:hypothetical protein|uniref:Uncharacterized protein n=1 Tax=Blastochloris tepida TaxID=2233851 RepID=A0A348G0Q4_9HYPH|nr:hypothetical protein [Blastochloris tepida]BBF93137.1 hypothetical protein BLTE_18220 [Blastochloris tepida]